VNVRQPSSSATLCSHRQRYTKFCCLDGCSAGRPFQRLRNLFHTQSCFRHRFHLPHVIFCPLAANDLFYLSHFYSGSCKTALYHYTSHWQWRGGAVIGMSGLFENGVDRKPTRREYRRKAPTARFVAQLVYVTTSFVRAWCSFTIASVSRSQ
jgi:hypothetical protein